MNTPFFRFLMVGLINTSVGLLSMYILFHGAGLSYWLSTFIGNTIGAFVSYLLNRTFTFKSNATIGKSSMRFILVIIVCYFVSFTIGKHFTPWALGLFPILSESYSSDIAILFSSGLYTFFNYFGQKIFVFPKTV
jgi:putative flippase GtrA